MKEDLRKLNIEDLQRLWKQKMDELFLIRKELDRRTGKDVKPNVEVDYTKYVTK